MDRVKQLIECLGLVPHPEEGGHYKETYRSEETIQSQSLPERYTSPKAFSTAIYYLLTPQTVSEMHTLPSDEVFHFYLGDPVEMLLLHRDGTAESIVLGSNVFEGETPQQLVRAGTWQGCCLREGGAFALLGATVAPGFDFLDYERGEREELIAHYPSQDKRIVKLTPRG